MEDKIKYIDKWQKENYKRVVVKMKIDNYNAMQEYFKASGITSQNGYIIDLIKADLNAHGVNF